MEVGLATLLFLVLAIGWTVLPFIPAVREIRRQRDIKPLPVTRQSQVNVRHFAHGFRAHLDKQYSGLLEQCRATGEIISGDLSDGGQVLVVPDARPDLPLTAEDKDGCQRVILGTGNLRLPDDHVHAAEIRAAGNVQGGADSVYRAILAEGSLELAAGSASLRWLHAGGDLVAGPACLLHGRVSADGLLRLAEGCRFERLHAATVLFGSATKVAPSVQPFAVPDGVTAVAPEEVPKLSDERGGRWLVSGDFSLADGAFLDTNLVVCGKATLGAGSVVRGSLKCRGKLTLAAEVQVSGSLIAAKDLEIGPGCRIGGPVVCEETLMLHRDAVIGSATTPTTVSTRCLLVAPGACCHGTVWAHDRGDVLVPTASAAAGGQST